MAWVLTNLSTLLNMGGRREASRFVVPFPAAPLGSTLGCKWLGY